MKVDNWYNIFNEPRLDTPALLVYPERVIHNIERAIAIAEGVDRLYPHIKTHKTAEIIQLHLERGITRFKCATLVEAQLLAEVGAKEILLAHQPVGPKADLLWQLAQAFPEVAFGTVVDDVKVLIWLSQLWKNMPLPLHVWLDIDDGMGRSGIATGAAAQQIYRQMHTLPGLKARGLHVYDGQHRQGNYATRSAALTADFEKVEAFREELESAGLAVPHIIAGGSPAFSWHATQPHHWLSPGTYSLWDACYQTMCPEDGFQWAAVLATRIISKPGEGRLCLDLGHKSVASEMPLEKRVHWLDLEVSRMVSHSEEHLVVESPEAAHRQVGELVHAIPWHICPTVNLHDSLRVVREGLWNGYWVVRARQRTPSFHRPILD